MKNLRLFAVPARPVNAELQRINEDYDNLLFQIPKLSDGGRVALARDASRANRRPI